MLGPVIEGERIRLEPPRAEHLATYVRWFADMEVNWRSRYGMTGIVIGEKDEWGKGYASDAMRLRTRYAFRELGLQKLITTVVGPNDASRRGLERAGYRQCGLYRRHFLVDGQWHDMWVCEIFKDDWEAQEGRA